MGGLHLCMQKPPQSKFQIVSNKVVRAMMYSSIVVTVVGLAMYLLADNSSGVPDYTVFTDASKFSFTHFLQGLQQGQATAIMLAGILLLMMIPLVRVIAAFFEYLVTRNFRYLLYTSIILIVIGLSVLLGASH